MSLTRYLFRLMHSRGTIRRCIGSFLRICFLSHHVFCCVSDEQSIRCACAVLQVSCESTRMICSFPSLGVGGSLRAARFQAAAADAPRTSDHRSSTRGRYPLPRVLLPGGFSVSALWVHMSAGVGVVLGSHCLAFFSGSSWRPSSTCPEDTAPTRRFKT